MSGNEDLSSHLRDVLRDVLQLGERAEALADDTPLLGALPELDSMAVVTLLSTLEERFAIVIHDDEITAEIFDTFASLRAYVAAKRAETAA
ncbi:MAG: acyl carrier protein [Alphaproteobacteria bacterium]|nr:MAG: acyl carrier protein [Alphaproteobacteria bacterium]